MAGYALVEVEGVLLDPDPESYAASQPILPAIPLVSALSQNYKVALSTAADEDVFGHWLANHYTGLRYTAIYHSRPPEGHFEQARQLGPLDLVVTSEPRVATAAVKEGLTVCCFAHPTTRYTGPPELRPWMEIAQAQRTRNQGIRAALRQTADLGPYE